MLDCQISINHGCLFGLRIIFAMDPECFNLADCLKEIKHCAMGLFCPREQLGSGNSWGAELPLASMPQGCSAHGPCSFSRRHVLCAGPPLLTPAPLSLLARKRLAGSDLWLLWHLPPGPFACRGSQPSLGGEQLPACSC